MVVVHGLIMMMLVVEVVMRGCGVLGPRRRGDMRCARSCGSCLRPFGSAVLALHAEDSHDPWANQKTSPYSTDGI